MPKVKDYMTTPVVTIQKNNTIAQAIKKMNDHNTNGLIVVEENDDSKVLGVLSSYDILKYLVPDYLEEEKHLASFEPSEIFITRAKQIGQDKVSQCLTVNPHTVNPEDSLIEAAALLTEYKIHRLPVVQGNKLVGYISKSDIKRALGKILGSQES